MKLACVLLAAGASARFGTNKLLYRLDGVSLLERALMLHGGLAYDERLLVTRRGYAETAALGRQYGFTLLYNDAPESGMGASAAIAAAALMKSDMDGALFSVCDQPYLRRESVERMLADFVARPDCIAACAHKGQRGNPCVFPRPLFSELAALEGERGGGTVIARHPDMLILTEIADASELRDLDVPPEEP